MSKQLDRRSRKGKKRPLPELKSKPDTLYIQVLQAIVSPLTHSTNPQINEGAKIVAGALRARDWSKLVSWADSASQMYGDRDTHFVLNQVSSLIRKYPFSERHATGYDPRAAALATFRSTERRCKRINTRFRLRRFWRHMGHYQLARRWIDKVLGPFGEETLESIYALCDFTGGASLGVHGNATNLGRKLLSEDWSVGPMALQYVLPALWNNIHIRDAILPGRVKNYDQQLFELIVRLRADTACYNKVSFVPKTAKTDRSIAVEPMLNGFIQKGIDEYMRSRLRRYGIDLSDQSLNSEMARQGSLGGFNPYVTIDLSAASDTIPTQVVKWFLPLEWFEFLDQTRSSSYLLDGQTQPQRYEKFTSMGNGFCFPLETLLFGALAHAASVATGNHDDFMVYGDDIVVRQSAALLLIELLKDCGFKPNNKKSFIVGPFRESCGSDWYEGADVRPAILDVEMTDIRHTMAVHNTLRRSQRVDLLTREAQIILRDLAPDFWRPGRELGDEAYSVDLDECVHSPSVRFVRPPSERLSLEQSLERGRTYGWLWQELQSRSVSDARLMDPDVHRWDHLVWCSVVRGANPSQPFSLRYISRPKRVTVQRWWRDGYFASHEEALGREMYKLHKRRLTSLAFCEQTGR